MGMYDELIVKKSLPLPKELKKLKNWKEYRFQTKDFDNYLGEYFINERGVLYEVHVEREYVEYSKEERESQNIKLWALYKEVIEKSRTNKKLDYHGKILFYTFEELDENTDFWLEFVAYFSYGKLDKIELVKFETETGRKERLNKWTESYKETADLPWNKFKMYLRKYLGWNRFWNRVISFLHKIIWFINRYIS
jgi:hypothetical protein